MRGFRRKISKESPCLDFFNSYYLITGFFLITDSKGSKAGKNKKKNHRKKDNVKVSSASNNENGSFRKVRSSLPVIPLHVI